MRISTKAETKRLSTYRSMSLLVAAIFIILLPASVHRWNPFKIGKAGEHAHQAISELSTTVNKLPQPIKDTIGSNIKLLSRDMDQMVSRINNQTVPLLNASLTTQLNHMTDLTNALTANLNEIATKGITQIERIKESFKDCLEHEQLVLCNWFG